MVNESKELILIIDDNQANLAVAEVHLTNEGYSIITATSAKQALQLFKTITPDLILLDIMMPVVDGYELCKIIKSDAKLEDIPLIFMTALNQSKDMVKGFDYGAVDYIIKPFNKDELISRVKNHLSLLNHTKTIKLQNEKLRRLNEEKNGIIELTAHDLNNPLQAVLGFSDVLLSKIPEEHQDLINYTLTIKSSAQKAVGIIKDLMEVNMIEQGKLKLMFDEFDVRDVLIKVIDDYLFLSAKKNQKIIYDESEDDCIIKTDVSKLERIFDNLISNAIKYSDFGGTIKISCQKVKDNLTKDTIKISIQDNGPGFTEDDKQKLFTKFAKLSAKPTADEASTGLGLSIVKKLTELLNGKIELESEFGKGANFIISF